MHSIEFTARSRPTSCDSCNLPTQAGISYIERGSIVMFDCLSCAVQMGGKPLVESAVEAHRDRAFRQMEALAG